MQLFVGKKQTNRNTTIEKYSGKEKILKLRISIKKQNKINNQDLEESLNL